MLWWNRQVIDHMCMFIKMSQYHQNVVKTSVMQLAVACEPLLFLPYFDVIFDLLLSRHMALWNRFVISNINIWLISGHRDPFEVL